MSYAVELETGVRREFLSLPRRVQQQIADIVDDLGDNPRPLGSKKLTNQEGYRVRKGDYRVLYVIDDRQRLVRVYRIAHRKDVYR